MEMEQPQPEVPAQVEPTQPMQSPPAKKSHLGSILWVFVSLVLLAGIGGVWWWQQQNINSLNAKVADLNGQVAGLNQQLQAKPDTTLPPVTYKADVGKFTLTLEKGYGIAVLHDAGAEGRAITDLLIAKTSSIPNVLLSNQYQKAEIWVAEHSLEGTTYKAAVKSDIGDSESTKLPSITIDGVKADVYEVAGLSAVKKVFFTKGDALYHIELTFMGKETDKLLNAIVKGFSFD